MQKLITRYNEITKKLKALSYFQMLASWDMETEAPPKSIPTTSEYLSVLAEDRYNLYTSQEYTDIVNQLYDNREQLDAVMQHELEVIKKDIENSKKIPLAEMLEFEKAITNGYPVYVNAKLSDDFASFLPTLDKVVEYNKKMTKWLETDSCKGYNVLLDQYEPKFPMSSYDEFFDVLKSKLVPFVKKVANTKLVYNDSFATKEFPVEQQKEFCQYLLDVICFDKEAGVTKESEHPFTSGAGKNDVRLTVHYYIDNIVSAIFSCIHEGGHALYEQNVADSLQTTMSGGGVSLGIHESQSRFFENIIGRSYPFWVQHYPKLVEIFPTQLEGVTVDDFYKHVCKVELSYIRTEADELTYPLHIMLRYDMEKKFIEGDLQPEQFASYWKETFNEYFGITPPTDTLGVLQDVHWAYGNVGYFPTYALGSAIASQLYAHMTKTVDVDKCLASGTTKEINEWLAEHIHKHGSSMYPMEILQNAVGEKFDPNYYVDYLIEKYSKIYNIK